MATIPDPDHAGHRPDLSVLQALLFDLDGVITRTATLHAAAWKRLLDDFMERWEAQNNRQCAPFAQPEDYLRHIDGKRRYDGVDAFLRSRAIELPWGQPADSPATVTVCGVGNAKNRYFAELLTQRGLDVYDDAVALIHAARARGLKLAVVSASENCRAILTQVGLLDQFDTIVSGTEAAQLGLAGKPQPDTYLKASELLGSHPPTPTFWRMRSPASTPGEPASSASWSASTGEPAPISRAPARTSSAPIFHSSSEATIRAASLSGAVAGSALDGARLTPNLQRLPDVCRGRGGRIRGTSADEPSVVAVCRLGWRLCGAGMLVSGGGTRSGRSPVRSDRGCGGRLVEGSRDLLRERVG